MRLWLETAHVELYKQFFLFCSLFACFFLRFVFPHMFLSKLEKMYFSLQIGWKVSMTFFQDSSCLISVGTDLGKIIFKCNLKTFLTKCIFSKSILLSLTISPKLLYRISLVKLSKILYKFFQNPNFGKRYNMWST